MKILHQDIKSDKEWECSQFYKTFRRERHLKKHIEYSHSRFLKKHFGNEHEKQ